MSPTRTSGAAGGSFRFDRVFEGVGRIQRSSGTDNKAEFRRRDVILTKLFENAQLETLRSFQRGDVTIEQLVEADRGGRLKSAELLSDMALRQPLWTAISDTLPRMGSSDETRRRYFTSLAKLQRLGARWLSPTARVGDLATVDWKQLSTQWGGSAADWNHLRRALSTFLTTVLGDVYHPLRRTVMKQIAIRAERPRVPDLGVEQFWKIVELTPEHARPCYVVLAASGMRLGEYLRCTKEHLRPDSHAIQVPGTKTAASADTVFIGEELWPWVEVGIPSPLQRGWMWKYWKRACKAAGQPDLRLHDLRHFFSQLADAAGASTEMVMAALRHTNPATTRGYKTRKDKGEVARMVGHALTQRKAG